MVRRGSGGGGNKKDVNKNFENKGLEIFSKFGQ
jgi:hypothetical protein